MRSVWRLGRGVGSQVLGGKADGRGVTSILCSLGVLDSLLLKCCTRSSSAPSEPCVEAAAREAAIAARAARRTSNSPDSYTSAASILAECALQLRSPMTGTAGTGGNSLAASNAPAPPLLLFFPRPGLPGVGFTRPEVME